jgi:fructose-specific phosphotransferase system IIC component
MRIFSGIVLGFLMFELLWRLLFRVTNTDPYVPASISFEAFAIAFGLLFALLSGYIASFIGGRPHFTAAKVVGLLIALGAIVVMVRRGIGWPQLSALLFMAPAAVVGGYSYVLSRRENDGA